MNKLHTILIGGYYVDAAFLGSRSTLEAAKQAVAEYMNFSESPGTWEWVQNTEHKVTAVDTEDKCLIATIYIHEIDQELNESAEST